MNTIRLVIKNHAIPDRKIMKKHMKNPFIFVITSLMLMTGSLGMLASTLPGHTNQR